MKQMFASATLKLTVWYLLIILIVSLLFSVIIYQISLSEASSRINVFQSRVERMSLPDSTTFNINFPAFRSNQIHETEASLFIGLLYANVSILLLGGIGSYLLARWTLKPIEAAHEAQSRFTSDASHELRTPLAVMKSELEVALRSANFTKQDMKELLESNLEEVNRLSELSTTLLKLSKQDETSLELTPVKLDDIIKKTLAAHSVDSPRITYNKTKKSSQVIGNSASLNELLMILLDNALRYSPADSPVILQANDSGSTVQIKIENSGQGISSDDIPHVFERFYRGDKARTSNKHETQGYGLGLALAKKIVDLHGGTISIISELNKSTSVTVQLQKA